MFPAWDLSALPSEHLAKAYENCVMGFIRNGLPILVELLGCDEARNTGRTCGLQIGMWNYDQVSQLLETTGSDAYAFLRLPQRLLAASADRIALVG